MLLKLGCIGVDGVGELEEHGAALFRRRVEPDLVVGSLRRAHRTFDVLLAGDGNLGYRLPGCRVDVVICLALGGIHPFPADEQRAVLLQVLLHGALSFRQSCSWPSMVLVASGPLLRSRIGVRPPGVSPRGSEE